MPELPETETIARDLDRAIAGARIVAVAVREPTCCARSLPERSRDASRGAVGAAGGGRSSWCSTSPPATGSWCSHASPARCSSTTASSPSASAASRPSRSAGRRAVLHYRDIRRLGTVALMSPSASRDFDAALGIEPLDPAFTAAHLSANSSGFRQAVKKVLMDQRRIAGIGNIYANEALWRARHRPVARGALARRAARRRRCTRDSSACCANRSRRAARASATTATRPGRAAAFAEQLAVYGRGGLPCPRCGAALGRHARHRRAHHGVLRALPAMSRKSLRRPSPRRPARGRCARACARTARIGPACIA